MVIKDVLKNIYTMFYTTVSPHEGFSEPLIREAKQHAELIEKGRKNVKSQELLSLLEIVDEDERQRILKVFAYTMDEKDRERFEKETLDYLKRIIVKNEAGKD